MFDAYCRLLHRLTDEVSWQESRYEMESKLLPHGQVAQRLELNATESPISEKFIHSLFFEQVPERPDQPAVITPKRTLNYSELQKNANKVAHWLRQQEARPNSLVAVVMEKGWEQVVAVLGILNSGAAYLPVDAGLPEERLLFLLENGQVSLVLTQSWYDHKIKWPKGTERFCVDRIDQLTLDESPLNPSQGPDDLAYVIYTSGTTGQPKGVMIDHRGVVNTVLDINHRFGMTSEDRVLALSALNFDLSVYDVFGILAAGGTIVLPEAFSDRNPAHWAELVTEHRVTIWNTVPALMQMLVEFQAGRSENLPKSLRLTMMSGDWIPTELPGRIMAMGEGIEIVSLGGATEASIWSILYPIKQVDPSWTGIPYGRPMVNQRIHVLNEAFTPCPLWVPGQLYIGGIGLAKGYWRDEEKTNASFITHPYTGERLYRTGDMGRCLPDGNIEFLGRDDSQVKIGGHRIELGEIETALKQHPRVQAAVVAAAGEERGNKRLVAYIVPALDFIDGRDAGTGEVCDQSKVSTTGLESRDILAKRLFAEELRDFLKGKLPGYMVPLRFNLLDALPLSANGKVDRKALPESTGIELKTETAQVEPRTEMERVLAGIWQEILGIKKVGVNENIFELGGDSVKAIQIIAKANHRGLLLSPGDIFEHQTITELAKAGGTIRDTSASLIKPVSRQLRQAAGQRSVE